MRYLRWIHKSWAFFWNFIGVLVLTVALVCGIAFGVLQMQPVKDRIAESIIEGFNSEFQGVLSIGELDGLLPLNMELRNIKLYPDSTEYEPVIKADTLRATLNLRSFLSNRYEVESLSIVNPEVISNRGSEQSVEKAFRKIGNNTSGTSGFPPDIEILVPAVHVENGRVLLRNIRQNVLVESNADSIVFQDINLEMFLEYTRDQRFLDINSLSFRSQELKINNATIFGQVYNDSQFLEFNAFNARLGSSGVRFSAEAEGVNLMRPEVWSQILSAKLDVNASELYMEPRFFGALFPEAPPLKKTLYASLHGEGSMDSLWFDKLQLSMGESTMLSHGYITHLDSVQQLGYGLSLENLNISEAEARLYSEKLNQEQLRAITDTRVEGDVEGSLDRISGNIALLSDRGALKLDGDVNFKGQQEYRLNMKTDTLNIGNLFADGLTKTNLTLTGTASGKYLSFKDGTGTARLQAGQGNLDGREFETFDINLNWDEGYLIPEYEFLVDSSALSGSGYIDLRNPLTEISLSGSAEQLGINKLLQIEGMRPSILDLEYDISLNGNTISDLYGQVSLDIPRAYAGDDTLSRHQFYLDFNAPDAPVRTLRLTSTALDATIDGNYNPSDLLVLARHWRNYFEARIQREILFNDSLSIKVSRPDIEDQSLTLSGRFKNPSLLKAYYPAFPSIETSARINSSIDISPDRVLFNGSISDQKFRYNDYAIDTLLAQVTGSFRYRNELKEFGSLQIQASATHFERAMMSADDFEFYTELNQDSLYIRTDINQLADNAFFNIEANGALRDSSLSFVIHDFNLGTSNYEWENNGQPAFTFGMNQKLTLDNFSFESGSQYVELMGTFSRSTEDSVKYIIRDLDLNRISSLIDGRIEFGGLLNGIFTTRTLTKVPTIQGNIDIKALNLNRNTVGDVSLLSSYNQPLNRFDTEIQVSTDSTLYPNYFKDNDRGGQEYQIEGYIMAPEDGEFPDADSLYAFDLEFENIDMWILPLIGPKVFNEASGRANGEGKFWGNLDTYDFRVDFNVGVNDAVYFQPKFLDTYYYAQGGITFTREQGLQFNDIYLIDPSGGNAILSGYFDFNDFQPVSYMDIRVEMNDFQFLNSGFDASVPFFGTAYGSSVVTIRGSNLSPVLSTETPLIVSDFSRIGIPLLEETEFNEDNKFIRFVNSFDLKKNTADSINGSGGFGIIQDAEPEDLSFAERFTLDLQFEANNPMTVDLIFDPVTGDQITANGTGRLRIRLEDQEVSMFGRFNITDGRYQFVSGDIFTRRFELEPGGTIIWEGSPGNARLDLNAVYRARPDINTLTRSRSSLDSENAQRERVPVELVLRVGGTLNSIENEFFFRLPDTFESRQNSTLATQLNALNRNQDEKLIQATSFLLMDNFIPVSNSGTGQTNTLSENISGSSAVLNPLLSNQVISPLLSNQINSLLNSDLSSFDVDFNLNTYNQVDLGVALRLYNDKLILRREGQITGRQSNIGDLGATYRINKTFSVTAFHRQDPTFGTLTSADQSQQSPQSQDINGVGVEATFSFNRWTDFFNRLSAPFRKLLGIKDKDEKITENTEGSTPSQGNK